MLDRYRGALIGLAVGDILGMPLEFKMPGSFTPVIKPVGGGPFNLEPGQWTDDTSMALCLADSLIECQGFNAIDQMNRYLRWYKEGYLSSTGQCFDIGNTVCTALESYQSTKNPFSGPLNPRSAGNGSIMRLAPIILFFANEDHQTVLKHAADSSRTTHGALEAIDSCRYLAALLLGALRGVKKDNLLASGLLQDLSLWQSPLVDRVRTIAEGSYKRKQPPDIKGTGYVIDSLEAALWAFYNSSSFAEGALLAVNLGDDADTTGAVYGQLAGAYYGFSAIPSEWSSLLFKKDYIIEMADTLFMLSERSSSLPVTTNEL